MIYKTSSNSKNIKFLVEEILNRPSTEWLIRASSATFCNFTKRILLKIKDLSNSGFLLFSYDFTHSQEFQLQNETIQIQTSKN